MFEWLLERERHIGGEDYEITAYNSETKMFVLKNLNDESTKEMNIFDIGINHNIDYFNNWQHELYTGLLRERGKITITVLSTETGDNWSFDIYRHKSLLNTDEFEEQIIITNYVISFGGDIKGDILSRHHKKYSGCAIDEEKEFSEWIEEQIGKVSEFNNTDYWNTFSAIVFSDCIIGLEEYQLLWNMFNDEI